MPVKKTKKKATQEDRLIMFHGTECPHCRAMDPLVEKLEKEAGVKITKIEVWHNQKNAEMMSKYDRGFCGGVPFFFNERTGDWLCGESSYEDLKKWTGVTKAV